MRKTFAPAAVAALLALTPFAVQAADIDPSKAAAGTYMEDPLHTSLTARISHGGGLSTYQFRFEKVDITYTYDPAKPAATVVTAKIDPRSISTGYEKHATDKDFNAELYGERFLNSVKFPSIDFKSTGIAFNGNKGKMTGEVTFFGVTKPITLDVTYYGSAVAGGKNKMGFSAVGVLKRSDFGFSAMVGPLGDDVTFMIESELVKQ